MRIISIKKSFLTGLKNIYPIEEVESYFYFCTTKYLGLSRLDIALKPDVKVDDIQYSQFLDSLKRLKLEEPIQYVLGETEFYGLLFKVDKNVLIPRPETEELIEWILQDTLAKNNATKPSKIKILDIGTGSGCIAISLARNIENAEVWALDISEKALQIAKKNASLNKVNIHFVLADMLSIDQDSIRQLLEIKDEKFDIVISNPPYVRDLEKDQMKNNVLLYEPPIALFVKNENPLIFYDKIASFSIDILKPTGMLFFEINQEFSEETKSLLKEKKYNNIISKKDIFNVNRMVKAERF